MVRGNEIEPKQKCRRLRRPTGGVETREAKGGGARAARGRPGPDTLIQLLMDSAPLPADNPLSSARGAARPPRPHSAAVICFTSSLV
ncbi:hypothetical protein EVAR_39333_1 [Eumeta japonica]|uniref:Uncharacterized protein n=1 Tax=Eumeta variegata TaxID=151549 RepID=A0A4C1WRN8_EUMVA|nr:hypothetical protein EVAR_39333_1 [Eumeta japonica]